MIDCWWERVEIETYLRRHFTPEELNRSKIVSLIRLIEKAKRNGSAK
jgi:hypothetical protein